MSFISMIQAAIEEYGELFNFGQETETEVAWPHLKVNWLRKDDSAGSIERKKKKR